jgi:hypothetical protein
LFFGIRSWRESDLIEPLRDHGVELRREDEEIRPGTPPCRMWSRRFR